MKLLAIDTTSDACSVALQQDDVVTERHHVESRAHTRILMPMIRELLDQRNLRTGELDAVVLGNGPGSFIGMRISASVVQGLCYGAGLPLLPVSSLAAVAEEVMADEGADQVVVAQDARMSEVYFASYRRSNDGLPLPDVLECIVPAGSGVALSGSGWIAAGAGWARYPELVSANAGTVTRVSPVQLPRARFLLPAGARAWQNGGGIDPRDLAPAYLRTRVAEPQSGGT